MFLVMHRPLCQRDIAIILSDVCWFTPLGRPPSRSPVSQTSAWPPPWSKQQLVLFPQFCFNHDIGGGFWWWVCEPLMLFCIICRLYWGQVII